MGNPIPLKFDFLQNGRPVRSEKLLLQDHLKVGKLSSSHLRIDDPAVSRMHAVIERRDNDQVELLDLGSTRGTMVNGERIDRRVLRSGDKLQFGSSTLAVYIGEADIYAAEQAAAAGGGAAFAAAPVAAPPAAVQMGGGPISAPPQGPRPAAPAPPMPGFDAQRVAAASARPQAAAAGIPQAIPASAAGVQVEDPHRQAVEVTFMWGDTLLRLDHYATQRDITIGGAVSCDYAIDAKDLGLDSFPLIKAVGTALALTFTTRMKGVVQTGEQESLSLEELVSSGRALPCDDAPGAYRFLLPEYSRCRVDVADVTFLIQLVPAPRKQAHPWMTSFSWAQLGAFGAAVLLWILIQTLFYLAIPEEEGFLLDSFDAAKRFAQLMVIPEKQKEPEVPDWFKKKAEEEAKKAAERAKQKEGKTGKQDAEDHNKRLAVKGPKENEDIQARREAIRQKVVQTGALAALSDQNELTMLMSTSDKAVGSDAVSALGNWTGKSPGSSYGMGGLGLSGTGRGGGGTGEGSIGVGGLGTRGRGGLEAGYGRGVGDLGDRSGRIPKVVPGKAMVIGSLDREIIRRIIGKHRDEIKYCYEKELVAHKDLSGKVVVFFTIAPTGSVVQASIKESTLKNPAAESCIVSRVRKWTFPQPQGGGIVEVTYPFIFKAI